MSTAVVAVLDRAALRRFDAKVEFEPRGPSGATKLLRRYFPDVDLNDRSIDSLASIRELSPGDFAYCISENQIQ